MLKDGALPHEIDQTMVAFGFPMGVFAIQDLSGLDIAWARRRHAIQMSATSPSPIAFASLGGSARRRALAGIAMPKAVASGRSIPSSPTIVEAKPRRQSIIRRAISENEIMQVILDAMQKEGTAILKEGIAASPDAIDVVMVNGYGFPRWRGGPMCMTMTR